MISNIKIGLLRETKNPVDNRVALSPQQASSLKKQYPGVDILAQASDIRAFTDEEYRKEGIRVVEDLSECDLLLGIKEAAIDSLLPGKHYVFFGHFAKGQEYNIPLLQALHGLQTSFSDYEYMVDERGRRVCAFGWWAGVVGVYYTLQGYGLRTGLYTLPKPDAHFTLAHLIELLKAVELPPVKMLLTGRGRVALGAEYLLREAGIRVVPVATYLKEDVVDEMTCTFAYIDDLVLPKEGGDTVSIAEFHAHPERFKSNFQRFTETTDLWVPCHFWSPGAPVYLSKEDYRRPGFRIRMIGDITCDIEGSVQSTLRASTHGDPFYDYNPVTEQEEPAFSSDENITVMAVDTCPNALPRESSHFFGEMLIEHVLRPLCEGHESPVFARATILQAGRLTPHFSYLQPLLLTD